MPLDSFVVPSSGSDSSDEHDSDSGVRRGGTGGQAAGAAQPPAPAGGQPQLLRVLSRLWLQQPRRGGAATDRGPETQHAGGHVAVPVAPSDGEQPPLQPPLQQRRRGQRPQPRRCSTLGSVPSLGGSLGGFPGDSLTSAEAEHLREALREQRSLSAKPVRQPRQLRRGSEVSAEDEHAFNEVLEDQLAKDTALGGNEGLSQHPSLAAPSPIEDGDEVAPTADDAAPLGVDGLFRRSVWPTGKHGSRKPGSGDKGKGSEDSSSKVAAGKDMAAVPGLPDQQRIEDWTEQHISELYKASLAKEVNVSRALWDHYTDPARQRRRRERGLKPSVMIGTVTQKITPFRGMRRRHSQAAAKQAGTRRLRRGWERLPVMYPTSLAPIIISLIVGLMDCTYSAFFIPITTVFDVSLTVWNWVTITDCCAAVIFTLDMVMTFSTGLVIVNSLREAVVMDRSLVSAHYVLRGTFAIDVLATGPLWVEVFVVATTNGHASKNVLTVLNVLRCFRLLRLVRVIRAAIKQSFVPTPVRWLPHGLGYFVNLTFTAASALVINTLGCIWYATARIEGIQEGQSWLSSVDGRDITGASDVAQYVAAIYWATTTIATVGYGDITPTDTGERVVAMCIMLLGVVFFAFILGAVGEFLEHASASAQQGRLFRSKMESVDRWMEARNLPRHMRSEITAFYSDIWTRHTAYHDNDFFGDLPAALRGKVARYRTRDCVAKSELGQALGPRALLVLSTVILPTALQPGHDLCQQGSPADRLWFLTEGSVLAIAHGRSMARVTAPAVLGESALLAAITEAPAKRPLTYRASVSCSLWELAVDDIMRMKTLQPGILDDLAAHFILQAEKSLRVMDKAHLRQLFPKASGPEDVIAGLQQEMHTAEKAQSVATEVIAALDVDVEALGGRRDIVMPSLAKVRALLEGDGQQDNENTGTLRTIGRNVITTLRKHKIAGGNDLADATNGIPSATSSSHGVRNAEAARADGAVASGDGDAGGEAADEVPEQQSLSRPTRFKALRHLDSRAPVDPERMSLAEAAAWTWHAGADDDAARAAVRAAAQKRVSAAMAGVGADTVVQPPASHAGHAGGPTASSGRELGLAAADPRTAATADTHRGSSSDEPPGQAPPEADQQQLPAAAGFSGPATGRPPGQAEAVLLARVAIAERVVGADSSISSTATSGEGEPQLHQYRRASGSATARRPLPWGSFGGRPSESPADDMMESHAEELLPPPQQQHQQMQAVQSPPGPIHSRQPGQRRADQQPSWADRSGGGAAQQDVLHQRPETVPEEEHSQLQELLDGRAPLTPQQRQRLADFMASASPEQAQLVHDSALLLEERRLEAAVAASLQRQAAAQAARDPLRHAWPERAPDA